MAIPSIRYKGTVEGSSAGLTYTPTGTAQINDLIILAVFQDNAGDEAITTPTGFRMGIGDGPDINHTGHVHFGTDGQNFTWCWKIAGGSEPSSYTWTLTSAQNASGGIVVYQNVNPTCPFDAKPTINNSNSYSSGAALTATGVTSGTPNRKLLMIFGTDSNGANVTSVAPGSGSPATWTLQQSGNGSSAGNWANIGFADCDDTAGTYASNVSASQTGAGVTWNGQLALLIALQPVVTPSSSNVTQVELAHFGTDAANGITLSTQYNMSNSASVNDVVVVFFTYNGGNGNPATPVLPTFTTGGATYSAAFANQTFIYDSLKDTTTASYVAIVTGSGTPWVNVSSLGGGATAACFIQMYTLRGLYVSGGVAGLVNAANASNSGIITNVSQGLTTAQSTIIAETACWPLDVFGGGGTLTNGLPITTNGIYQSFPISQGYMTSGWLSQFPPGYYSVGALQTSANANQNASWLALKEATSGGSVPVILNSYRQRRD